MEGGGGGVKERKERWERSVFFLLPPSLSLCFSCSLQAQCVERENAGSERGSVFFVVPFGVEKGESVREKGERRLFFFFSSSRKSSLRELSVSVLSLSLSESSLPPLKKN